MKPITPGFHHITMVSADAQRTMRFYRDLLGIGMVKRTVNYDDPASYHLYFGDTAGTPGTLLTFFEWPRARRGHWGVGGIHHLAMGVETPELQLMWKRRLMDAGVGVAGPYNRSYFRSIYFADPDGQILEIATAGPGYDVDEPIDRLGQTVILPDPELLPGRRDEAAIKALTHPEPVPEVIPEMMLRGFITSRFYGRYRASERVLRGNAGYPRRKKSINQDDPNTPHWFWGRTTGQPWRPQLFHAVRVESARFYARAGPGRHITSRSARATPRSNRSGASICSRWTSTFHR
jgi:glyoxalase family protein